ncbi:MAG: hypothetical protein E7418_02760 [Ruminococcaceae bacterium]|nr:hypothetical protein [Oscillospiraceae bacterium]
MSRNTSGKQKPKSSATKKALIALGVVLVLFALFMLSFFVTTYLLQLNQAPNDIGIEPTPKPSYEELEKMVIEKEERIQELEDRLETYRNAAGENKGKDQATAKPTVKPTSSPTATPTKAPTAAPTKAPTQTPTIVPTQAPVATNAPAETGSEA